MKHKTNHQENKRPGWLSHQSPGLKRLLEMFLHYRGRADMIVPSIIRLRVMVLEVLALPIDLYPVYTKQSHTQKVSTIYLLTME
jgi:hypothetical protein